MFIDNKNVTIDTILIEGFIYADSSVTETEIEKISMIVQMCFFKTLKKFKVSIDN